MPFQWNKLAVFVSRSTWDLLVPGVVTVPMALVRNFYECFFAAAPEDRKELLQEAQQLRTPDVDAIVQEVIAGISQQGSGQPAKAEVQSIAQQLVDALREAGLASQRGENSSEALCRALNQSVLAGAGQQVAPREMSPEQKSVGRLLVSSILAGGGGSPGRGQRGDAQAPPYISGYEALRLQ